MTFHASKVRERMAQSETLGKVVRELDGKIANAAGFCFTSIEVECPDVGIRENGRLREIEDHYESFGYAVRSREDPVHGISHLRIDWSASQEPVANPAPEVAEESGGDRGTTTEDTA